MLDLSLFRIRNFWVANLTTLTAYAGLIGGLFFVGLFLQQVAGYSPLEAGLATTPISVLMFFLSPRFGRIASGTGPRLPMCVGPIVGGIGLILLLRVGADPDYVADVLPAILVFGLGLSATVAPLTATVLDSVEERHVGIASGVNNGVSRVAGPAGDRRARRGDLGQLRLDARRQARPAPLSAAGAERSSRRPRNSRLRFRRPETCGRRGRAGRRRRRPTPRPRPSTSASSSPAC